MSRNPWTIAILIAALALGSSPARAACVANLSDNFGDGLLTPHWVDNSGAVGSVSESGGRLVLTRNNGIVGAALASQAPGEQICGDFDITVDYDLGTFLPAASGSGRYHTMILRDRATSTLVCGVERYREQANACIPFTDSYKFYTNDPGCTPNALYVATSDTQGKFRLARTNATIHGYYWNGTAWVESMTRSITTAPLSLDFDSGTNGSLTTGHTAYFDNLQITSASTVPASSPAGLLALACAVLGGGALALRRRVQRA